MDTSVHLGNELQLPGSPFDLPDAQPHKAQGEQEEQAGEQASLHGVEGRLPGDIGIMLALR